MFDNKSIVARTWANAIRRGDRTIEEIPNISNLIDIVVSMVEEVDANV